MIFFCKQGIKAGSRPPWVGLAAAVWIEFGAGNAYTFTLYSSALKSVLGFSQQQIAILGVANDIGENLGILAGIACNHLPPWVILFCGALCCLLGYGTIWLAVTQTLQNLPYWSLWIALVIAANSCAWLGTATLVTSMRNFPHSRGTVAGILKGYTGISAAIFTAIYCFLLNDSPSKLLLFLTVGTPSICLTTMYFIRPCTPASGKDPAERQHFLFTQGMSIFLGTYLLTTTLTTHLLSLSNAVSYTFASIAVVIMFSPLAIPIKMTLFTTPAKELHDQPVVTLPLLAPSFVGDGKDSEDCNNVEVLLALGKGAVEKKRRPRRGEDFMFHEAMIKADFWLLWIVYFVGSGTGVTVVNNLAQIGYAQGVDDTTVLLALLAFGNFLGRLSGGAVSEHFVRSRTLPRTIWMSVTQMLMLITFLVYASALSGTLYPATLLLGICYGVQFVVMIPTVSELFGLKTFGVFYNVTLMGNPLGALLFSGWLAGYVYDTEAAKQGSSTCTGAVCFRLTFLILAGVCGLGSMLSVWLSIRIRPVYQSLYSGESFNGGRGTSLH